MDTGKNIWIQKSSRVIKGLIVSYLVSGAGLLLLALLLLKYQLDERESLRWYSGCLYSIRIIGRNLYGKNSRKKKIL